MEYCQKGLVDATSPNFFHVKEYLSCLCLSKLDYNILGFHTFSSSEYDRRYSSHQCGKLLWTTWKPASPFSLRKICRESSSPRSLESCLASHCSSWNTAWALRLRIQICSIKPGTGVGPPFWAQSPAPPPWRGTGSKLQSPHWKKWRWRQNSSLSVVLWTKWNNKWIEHLAQYIASAQ